MIGRTRYDSWFKIRYDHFNHPYEKIELENTLDSLSKFYGFTEHKEHIDQLTALIQQKGEENKNAPPLGLVWERRECKQKLPRMMGSLYFLSDRIHVTLDRAVALDNTPRYHFEPIDPDDYAQIEERIAALERENKLLPVSDKISDKQRKKNERTIKRLKSALDHTERFLIRDLEQIQLFPKWPPKIGIPLPPTKGLFGKKKAQMKTFEITEKAIRLFLD